MIECWKQIEGFPYEVSDLGRVRRSSGAKGARIGRVLRPATTWNGYSYVGLSSGCDRIMKYAHILVAAAFLGARSDGHDVNHKNGIKTDNAASNLEYSTHSQNILHALSCGLSKRGSQRKQAKVSEEEVVEIRRLCTIGWQQHRVASEFGISQSIVSDIHRGVRWQHVQYSK